MVFGPNITDNCVPTREAIEERFKVPAISVTGTDDWLGEWTFAFPQGSMTDEPIFWADLLAKGGHTEVGVLVEQSLIGESYVENFREGVSRARASGSWPRSRSRRPRRTSTTRCARCTTRRPRQSCTAGSGSASCSSTLRWRRSDWDPPRFMGTAFQNAWINPIMWNAIHGLDRRRPVRRGQPVGQEFLDRYAEKYDGRDRSTACRSSTATSPTVLLHAFADAHPLSPRGVKEALERVKMVPAASGAPGTRVSFGKWTRAGLDGRRLPGGPRRSIPTASTPISSIASARKADHDHAEESTPPDTQAGSTGPGARAARTGGAWIAGIGVLAFVGLFAAVSRTALDPRVANPNIDGRPRPVEFLFGSTTGCSSSSYSRSCCC